jgi:hypothetical protein
MTIIRTRTAAAAALLAAGALACASLMNSTSDAMGAPRLELEFTDDGELVRPEDYREWIFVGTPVTPDDMNNGHAPFPEFHNVYIDPASWDHYKRTGDFREGATLVKELVSVGEKQATSGNGYFMDEFIGLEVTIKSAERFPEEPGNWAYYSFGHEYPLADTAKPFPAQACNACHESTAADDFVFTQYYPQLRDARGTNQASVPWTGPRFDSDRQLIRPEGYREWVYIGTPLTPHDMNNGNAPFPEFHAVYIDRESFAHYEQTGEFRDGTTLVKELIGVGSKQAVSGNGYFMGDFTGLEVTIKSEEHFPDEPGNWAYYSFGHEYPLAPATRAMETVSCNACHSVAAAEDFVFTQYYPVLPAARPRASQPASAGMTSHDGEDCEDCELSQGRWKETMEAAQDPAAEATGGTFGLIPTDKQELFEFLIAGDYKSFPAKESGMHASNGPHSIEGKFGFPVRTYLNATINDSLEAGNTTHPKGSGIVKEMFSKAGELEGFAVSVKTQDDSDGGNGWFWYEVTSVEDPGALVANGNGVPLCFGCHASSRSDFVLTDFPLK